MDRARGADFEELRVHTKSFNTLTEICMYVAPSQEDTCRFQTLAFPYSAHAARLAGTRILQVEKDHVPDLSKGYWFLLLCYDHRPKDPRSSAFTAGSY